MLTADGHRKRTSDGAHEEHLREAEVIAREAEAAGDAEMARLLRSRAALVRRGLWDFPNTTKLVRADGTSFPLLAARDHVRRGGSRAGATTTSTATGSKRGRPGATMAGDLAALNAVLAGATPRCTRASAAAVPCDICGRDTLDVFGCQCDDD